MVLSGRGWSDRNVLECVTYSVQVSHVSALFPLSCSVFWSLITAYNWHMFRTQNTQHVIVSVKAWAHSNNFNTITHLEHVSPLHLKKYIAACPCATGISGNAKHVENTNFCESSLCVYYTSQLGGIAQRFDTKEPRLQLFHLCYMGCQTWAGWVRSMSWWTNESTRIYPIIQYSNAHPSIVYIPKFSQTSWIFLRTLPKIKHI